jgi:hypothetical protein
VLDAPLILLHYDSPELHDGDGHGPNPVTLGPGVLNDRLHLESVGPQSIFGHDSQKELPVPYEARQSHF